MARRWALAKLQDQAQRAGRWLELSALAVQTPAVECDWFDQMTWAAA